MNQFKDFQITANTSTLKGDKIKIERIFNREITVHGFTIKPSKYNSGECLWLQISIGEIEHVVFSGSGVLREQIKKVPPERFPFNTTIVKDNDAHVFT
jgi:hypothetical protein